MKQLSKIIFVNWYLFEANEWDICGNTALLGANGAGKSSFLDGIQYAIFAGDKRYWRPNAKAPGHKTVRDARSYMLGVTKTEEAIAENSAYKPRESALSRIVLVFEDTDTGVCTSIGVAAHVRIEDSREEHESFFVVEGLELGLNDLLTDNDQGSCPKDVKDLEAFLRRSVPSGQCHILKNGTEYREQMLTSLGPAGRPPSLEKFQRSFKQSITQANLDGSVSDFVKTSILDASPVDAQRMRQARNSYLYKLEAVKRIIDQIQHLESIQKELERANVDSASALSYEWCAAETEVQRLDNKIADDQETMASCLESFWGGMKQHRRMDKDVDQLRGELTDISVLLKQDDNQAKVERLKEEGEKLRQQLHTEGLELTRCRKTLSDARKLVGKGLLKEGFERALEELSRESVESELLWPMDPVAVDLRIVEILESSQQQIKILDQENYRFHKISDELEDELKALIESSGQLEQGRRALRGETRRLQDILQKHGIRATPVCELIEVRDKSWQKSVEAYLKTHVEALIVNPDDALRAISVYRSNRDNLFGSIVVNTQKVQTWSDSIQPGTAAGLIQGDDANAVKYVQRLLRNLNLVESDEELSKDDRAITKDGMSAGNGGIQKMRLPHTAIIGAGAIAEQLEQARYAFQAKTEQKKLADEKYTASEKLLDKLRKTVTNLEHLPSLVSLTRQIADNKNEASRIEAMIEAIDLSKTEELRKRHEVLQQSIKQLETDRTKVLTDATGAKSVFKRCKSNTQDRETELPELDAARARIEQAPLYNVQKAAEVMESLEETHDISTQQAHRSFVNHCREKAQSIHKRAAKHKETGARWLGEYNSNNGQDGLDLDDLEDDNYLALVLPEIEQLKSTGLANRETEMKRALSDAEFFIRQDLAVRLKEQITTMKVTLRTLNRELKERPFSAGLVYQFHYERKSEYTAFIDFVEGTSVEDAANLGGLFDDQNGLSEIFDHLLTSDGDEGHVDYRDYFTYDIEVIDQVGGFREMMSRKKASGSGGEQRSPFYVAMGSSLASAYRINSGPEGNDGFGLYLADEAFQSMDAENTEQAANYLKSIGLQLFLAAPDESEAKITPCVETILFFIREGNRATVDVQYLTSKARELIGQSLKSSVSLQ